MDKSQPLSLDGSVAWSNDMFTPELQAAINDIIPSQDPLDRHDFNPVKFINDNFANVHIDAFMHKLAQKIHKIDDEIIQEVRMQSTTSTKGKEDLENAKRSIKELLTKIGDIKSKAIRSEQMVTEICKDIKSLDFAKKNLATAITTLKRLHMMVMASEQLKVMVNNKNYAAVANLLQATAEFSDAFKDYRDSPKISSINRELTSLRTQVEDQIYDDFKNYIPQVSNQVKGNEENRWRQACYVIDSLGSETKKGFLRWFSDTTILTDYKKSFGPSSDFYNFDFAEKRYSWIKKQIKRFREEYKDVFPIEWGMEEYIAYEFCEQTRLALSNILLANRANANNGNGIEIATLLRVLNKTLEFETELYKSFSRVHANSPRIGAHNQHHYESNESERSREDEDEPEHTDGQGSSKHSVSDIQQRWMKEQERLSKQQSSNASSPKSESSKSPAMLPTLAPEPPKSYERFRGIISSCFDPYMDLYIKEEDKKMSEALHKLVSEEKWVHEEDREKMLTSGTDLVVYFRSSLERCASLSKGDPFFDLFGLFKKYLNEYATVLSSKIQSNDIGRQHEEAEDKVLILIINTAEYFNKTINQMSEKFKKIIIDRYKNDIDFMAQKKEFSSVITKGVKSIGNGIEARLEPHLQTLTKTDWGERYQYVGDHSPYIDSIIGIINESTKLEASWLSPVHYRYFCDLFANSLILRITHSIYRCGRISEIGAQGMQLDIATIKQCLLALPEKIKDGSNNQRYIAYITNELGKTESILKVVGCPKESLVETYAALIPEGSPADFQKIMDLKGIKTSDKMELLNKLESGFGGALTSLKKFLPVTNLFTHHN
eukprot:gene6171-7146_t